MDFKTISIEDKNLIDRYLKIDGEIMTERCFADLFVWKDTYNTKFCIEDDMLFLSFGREIKSYSVPSGYGDIYYALKKIKEDAKSRGIPCRIWGITKNNLEVFKEYCPTPTRDSFDYIYDVEEFRELRGKKLHSKRNFVNRFKSENEGNWEYRDIDFNDTDEIFKFLDKWYKNSALSENDKKAEKNAITLALQNAEALRLLGGTVYLNGEIIAFSLAAPQNDEVVDVLFEKAFPEIKGAYQIISNEFCKNCFGSFKYINREEDMGIEGLRKAKLSYSPIFLTEKYEAIIN